MRSATLPGAPFETTVPPSLMADPRQAAVLRLAHAVAASPARVDAERVRATVAALSPAEIVETICWISIG